MKPTMCIKIDMQELHESARLGQVGNLDVLLDAGADINAQDDMGNTALIIATNNINITSSIDVIELLIDRGCNLNTQNTYDWTALMYVACSHFRATKLLVDHGCDINRQTFDDRIALVFAFEHGQNDIFNLLLSKHIERGDQLCSYSKIQEDDYFVLRGIIKEKYNRRERLDMVLGHAPITLLTGHT